MPIDAFKNIYLLGLCTSVKEGGSVLIKPPTVVALSSVCCSNFAYIFLLFKGKNLGSVRYFANLTEKGKSKFNSYLFSYVRTDLIYSRVGGNRNVTSERQASVLMSEKLRGGQTSVHEA